MLCLLNIGVDPTSSLSEVPERKLFGESLLAPARGHAETPRHSSTQLVGLFFALATKSIERVERWIDVYPRWTSALELGQLALTKRGTK